MTSQTSGEFTLSREKWPAEGRPAVADSPDLTGIRDFTDICHFTDIRNFTDIRDLTDIGDLSLICLEVRALFEIFWVTSQTCVTSRTSVT